MIVSKRMFSLALAFLASTIPCTPQNGGETVKGGNLYAAALFAAIAEMNSSWGKIDDSYMGARTDYHHMIVVRNPEITDDLPRQMGEYQVEYLDVPALIARYKSLGKSFSVLEIHPIKIDGGKLTIDISEPWFSYRKRRALFGISDWADVDFYFDCATQTFVVSQVKLGGI